MSVLHIFVGQCGNQVGSAMWKILDSEPSETQSPFMSRPNVLRCLMIDTEPKVVHSLSRSNIPKDQILHDKTGRGNNWAMGYAHSGQTAGRSVASWDDPDDRSLIRNAMLTIRKNIERSEEHEGCVVYHSLAGGTGSGLGCRIIEEIRKDYPRHYILSIAIAPFTKGETPLQNYNSLLSLSLLQRNADGIILFHNEELMRVISKYKLLQRGAASKGPLSNGPPPASIKISLDEMNTFIATSLCGLFFPIKRRIGKSSEPEPSSNSCAESVFLSDVPEKTPLQTTPLPPKLLKSTRPNRGGRSAVSDTPSHSRSYNPKLIEKEKEKEKPKQTPKGPSKSIKSKFIYEAEKFSLGELIYTCCPDPSFKFLELWTTIPSRGDDFFPSWQSELDKYFSTCPKYDLNDRRIVHLQSRIIVRGDEDDSFSVYEAVFRERYSQNFKHVGWNESPIDMKLSCANGLSSSPRLITACSNSTRHLGLFQHIFDRSLAMYEVGAYLQWYERYGCDKARFEISFQTLDSIITAYREISKD